MAVKRRLAVDPLLCDGRGLCAELAPERVTLDDWGFPNVDPTPLGRRELHDAKRAVRACPVLALRIEPTDRTERTVIDRPRR
jgi:ferredoxin